MKPTSFHLHLSSEDSQGLMAFYRDTVGLPPQQGMEDFAVQLSQGASLGFGGHSETHGRSKEPSRVLCGGHPREPGGARGEGRRVLP